MNGFLRWVRTPIESLLSRETTLGFGGNSAKDWLPPVLGPADWSHGLMAGMADSSSAWYFERH